MTPLQDFQSASVIASCANPSPQSIISQYGKRIIRISPHAVAKSGPDVTKEEADNQSIAHELVDSQIVRVPRTYGSVCSSSVRSGLLKGKMATSTSFS